MYAPWNVKRYFNSDHRDDHFLGPLAFAYCLDKDSTRMTVIAQGQPPQQQYQI